MSSERTITTHCPGGGKLMVEMLPNQSAAPNHRPAGQSDASSNLVATVAADRELPAGSRSLER